MSFQWVTLLRLTSMVVPQKKTICFKEIARIAGDGVARPSAPHTGKQSTDGVLAVMRVKSRAALVCACTNMRLGSDDPKVIPVEVYEGAKVMYTSHTKVMTPTSRLVGPRHRCADAAQPH